MLARPDRSDVPSLTTTSDPGVSDESEQSYADVPARTAPSTSRACRTASGTACGGPDAQDARQRPDGRAPCGRDPSRSAPSGRNLGPAVLVDTGGPRWVRASLRPSGRTGRAPSRCALRCGACSTTPATGAVTGTVRHVEAAAISCLGARIATNVGAPVSRAVLTFAIACLRSCGTPSPRYRFARRAASPRASQIRGGARRSREPWARGGRGRRR
jgi:hypothetical protein